MKRKNRAGARKRVLVIASTMIVALASVVVASSLAASTARRDATIPKIVMPIASSISTLDYARGANGNIQTVENIGMETLVMIQPDGSLEPWLASSVKHPSALRYVYTIRQGVKFWDGNELTATDVANSLNYYRYKGFPTSTQLGYPAVRNITATDDHTVVVNLKQKSAAWPYTPALDGWIFEKKFEDDHGTSMGTPGVLMMGTGPFKYDNLDPTSSVELSANPHYWGGKVVVQHISVPFIPDATTTALAFRAGNIDVTNVAGSNAAAFVATSGARLTTFTNCASIWDFGMNTKLSPWSDVHVRRAVAYAINRDDIIAAAGGTKAALPINTLINPYLLRAVASKAQIDTLLKSINLYPFDLAKAKAEMAKSAYPNGFTSTLPTYNFTGIPEQGQALAGDLAKIGITLQVNALPIAQVITLANGPHDQVPTFQTAYNCQAPLLAQQEYTQLHSKNAVTGKRNLSTYTNPKVDAALDDMNQQTDHAKLFADASTVLKELSNDVPYVPIYGGPISFALSPKYSYPKFNPWVGPTANFDPRFLLGIRPK